MTLLVRGKHVICKVLSSHDALVIDDGAVAVEGEVIVECGSFSQLRTRYPGAQLLGSDDQIVLPGLINAHHHVGLTPFQLGSPDMPLELWSIWRNGARDVDPYLDTLYSAFEMVQSGVTTVQHLHGRGLSGDSTAWYRAAREVLRAYSDLGMRVTYSVTLRDQNRLVHDSDEVFIETLPSELRDEARQLVSTAALGIDEQFNVLRQLQDEHRQRPSSLVRFQVAPANLQWCSDATLERARELAQRDGQRVHIHLLETLYQRKYALQRYGTSGVRHLHDLAMLGPNVTLAHAVWIDEGDVELIASSGAYVCHNASSNLRLRSGIAPICRLQTSGVPLAIGIDEAGINDDRDMFAEMRLVLDLHHAIERPSAFGSSPTGCDVFRMATEMGAHSTGYGSEIGALEPGRAADMVLLDWPSIADPYLDPDVGVLDAVIRRGRPSAVRSVLVSGKMILREHEFTQVDRRRVLEELATSLRAERTPDEIARLRLAKQLRPHVEAFYEGWSQSMLAPMEPRNAASAGPDRRSP